MIDFDTLNALRLLLEHRHISRAAAYAGITQPAMSRTLMRLQHLFADPLLVRTPQGFELTPRAQALYPQLLQTLAQMQALIRPQVFDPKTTERQFTIAAIDYEMIIVLIPLLQKLTHQAPGIHLNIQQQWGENFSDLTQGTIDFLISGEETAVAGLYRQVLYQDEFVCVVNNKHTFAGKKITLKDYLSLKHIVVSVTGIGKSEVDLELAAQGLKRQVVASIPSFTVAALMCQRTSYACILPKRLVQNTPGLKLLKLPFAIPTLTIYLYWHARLHKDPESVWIRKLMADTEI